MVVEARKAEEMVDENQQILSAYFGMFLAHLLRPANSTKRGWGEPFVAPAVRAARDSVESNLVQAQGQRDLTLAMCVPERLPCYQNNKLSHESV